MPSAPSSSCMACSPAHSRPGPTSPTRTAAPSPPRRSRPPHKAASPSPYSDHPLPILRRIEPMTVTVEPALPERPGTAGADRCLPADHPPSLQSAQTHNLVTPVSRARSSDQRDDGAEHRIVLAPAPDQPLAPSAVPALDPCALSRVLARCSPTFVVRLRFIRSSTWVPRSRLRISLIPPGVSV